MTITLTRFNQTASGYTKRDEHPIATTARGADDINLLIQDYRNSKRPAKALSFGIYEDGEMSGATWRQSSALIIDFRAGKDVVASISEIAAAASKLRVGHFLLDCQERDGHRTIAVVIPLTEHVSKDRYGRLVYVLLEEMKANGCRHSAAKGTSAMTHQLHLHHGSEAAWIDGPALNPTQKIRDSRNAAQDMERDRFTVAAQAADVQIDPPLWTGLFEGLR